MVLPSPNSTRFDHTPLCLFVFRSFHSVLVLVKGTSTLILLANDGSQMARGWFLPNQSFKTVVVVVNTHGWFHQILKKFNVKLKANGSETARPSQSQYYKIRKRIKTKSIYCIRLHFWVNGPYFCFYLCQNNHLVKKHGTCDWMSEIIGVSN